MQNQGSHINRTPLFLAILFLTQLSFIDFAVAADVDQTMKSVVSKMCLAIRNAATASGADLTQEACVSGKKSQIFLFKTLANGRYTIMPKHVSNMCLEDVGTLNSVVQKPCSGSAAQSWSLSGVITKSNVVNASSGKCFNLERSSMVAGAKIIIYGCNTDTNEQFEVSAVSASPNPSPSPSPSPTATPKPSPTPTATPKPTATPTPTPTPSPSPSATPVAQSSVIRVVSSKLCLAIRGDSVAAGAELTQDACVSGKASQSYSLKSVGTGVVTISPMSAPSLCLQDQGLGNSVVQVACSSSAAQKWSLVDNTQGSSLKNSSSGLCVNVARNSWDPGAQLITYTCGQDLNEQFLVEASSTAPGGAVQAVSASEFLDSLGINIHRAQGVAIEIYIPILKYLGVRNVRDGFTDDQSPYVRLHNETGVKVNMIVHPDLNKTFTAAKTLAAAGALLSLEGANEPNNWPITYNGQVGGGSGSWMAVGNFQRDLYAKAKADSILKNYPIFHISEGGGQTDNVGLQFITIPSGAGTLMPAGTKFSDYANVHNYVESRTLADNQAWNAADPTLNGQWDGLFAEYSQTWAYHYQGYNLSQLAALPRVTTETGWHSATGGERQQGVILLNTYLAQFKRGFKYTFIYQARDGEGGAGTQGVYNENSAPKLAATYIHNLTTLLADVGQQANPGKVNYSIANQPATMHDLLLQKSDGTYELVVWGEKIAGSDSVTLNLGAKFSSVKVYDPTVGTTAIQTLSNVQNVPLTVSDHPLVIEFK